MPNLMHTTIDEQIHEELLEDDVQEPLTDDEALELDETDLVGLTLAVALVLVIAWTVPQ